jgi:hypothetical protein
MIFHTPSNGRWFRCYDFYTTTELLKLYSGQIAVAKEKYDLGLLGWVSSPELNTKNVDNSPNFLLVTQSALSS